MKLQPMTAIGHESYCFNGAMAVTRSFNSGAAVPAHGDILIAKDTTYKNVSYVLSILPGLPQIRCRTYDHAVSAASAWALERRVTIWFTQNGRTFTMVTPTSGTGAPHGVMELRHVE